MSRRAMGLWCCGELSRIDEEGRGVVAKRMVIGYHHSESALRAFAAGVELACAIGAEIVIVAAFEDEAHKGRSGSTERAYIESQLETAAASLPAGHGGVTTVALLGEPTEVLVHPAKEHGADLIVVGNLGTQSARRVLGTIAGGILKDAPCDVLVVKST